ncbi:MAG: hypothetical protein ACT4R6_00250 [Gemmatimonadaceae bacterium]
MGFALVRYDEGRTLGALTLSDALFAQTERSLSYANALVSFFDDARWSVQGTLSGARYSEPLPAPAPLAGAFKHFLGDLTLSASTTMQDGFMPTLHVLGETGLTFTSPRHALRAATGVARTFDGGRWRTTVLSVARAWWDRGRTRYTLAASPVQLQAGDILGDVTGSIQFEGRGSGPAYELTGGVRAGEAIIGRSMWGSLTAAWPIPGGLYLAASIGSYPVDLLQSLPGGRYAALSLRVPNEGWPFGLAGGRSPRPRVPVVPPPPARPELPTQFPLAIVVGEALDSLFLREVRVWAPGIPHVELMADFTDWVPVPLVRQAPGDWQGYYRVPPGARRIHLRLNGNELAAPLNLARIDDDFVGTVGVMIVR